MTVATPPALQDSTLESGDSQQPQQPSQQAPTTVRDSATPVPLAQYPALSLHNLQMVAADIKDTLTAAFSAAIADLRHDLQDKADRVQETEAVTTQHDAQIEHIHLIQDTHTLHIWDMQRHMEDLDNRGHKNNLRGRGVPKSIENDQIQQTYHKHR